jgi:hypothetical protein
VWNLRWLEHSKHLGHGWFILVRAFEPYVQQYDVLRVRNAQMRVLTAVELRERERVAGDCVVLS